MKKVYITLLCLSVGVMSVQAKQPPQNTQQAATNGPKFNFTGGDTYDFGTIQEGPAAVHKFEFKNTGNSPLIIMNATASCSCTVPEWPRQPILPGKTGEVTVSYTTQGHVGPFMKDVYIQSNAMKSTERYTVHIKGTVEAKK